jgi:hypothetical protein
MVLAAFGQYVTESKLEHLARMDVKGTPIDELVRLARHYGLEAGIQDTTVEGLGRVLSKGCLPIAFIDRAVFEMTPHQRAHYSIRNAVIHNVIPVHITPKSVTVHDPRQPRVTRKSMRLFRMAYEGLGGRCVVCSRAESFKC